MKKLGSIIIALIIVISVIGNIWQYHHNEKTGIEAWNKYRKLNSAFAGLTAKAPAATTDSEEWHGLSRKIRDLGYFLADY